jgi:hypothetical protein
MTCESSTDPSKHDGPIICEKDRLYWCWTCEASVSPPEDVMALLRLFPDLRIPGGLTFEDLEAASEIVLAWQDREDEFVDDFRGLKLAARLCEYFRAVDSMRRRPRPPAVAIGFERGLDGKWTTFDPYLLRPDGGIKLCP